MSWRVVSVVFIVVFTLSLVGMAMAGPLTQVSEDLNETGDYSDNGEFDGNALITGLDGAWFNVILIGIFGIIAWGAARILREELTRGGL
jgi:hypothetical protein